MLRFRNLNNFFVLVVYFFLIEIKSKFLPKNELKKIQGPQVGENMSLVNINTMNVNSTDMIQNRLNRKPIFKVELQKYIDDSKHYAYFAGTAYCSYQSIPLFSCSLCENLKKNDIYIITPLEEENEDLYGFIAEDAERKEIILSIRGSVDEIQIMKLVTFSDDPYPNVPNSAVHRRFFEYTNLLLPKIENRLTTIFNQHHFQGYKLTITGHSLGGAIAVLALPFIQKSLGLPWESISLYTYGQPRVGNAEFAAWFGKLPITYIRYVNGRDLVPHVPPYDFGYKHSNGELFEFDGKVTFCQNDEQEDDDCSNSLNFYSPVRTPHEYAWGLDLRDRQCENNKNLKYLPEDDLYHPSKRNIFLRDGSINPDFLEKAINVKEQMKT